MKSRNIAGICMLFIVCAHVAKAQEPISVNQQPADKPFIFFQFPERVLFPYEELQKLFSYTINTSIDVSLEGGILLRGQLINKIQRSQDVISVTIKLSEYKGALFSLTFIHQPNQPTIISGRIIHPQSGDVLVLSKENNQYYLTKKLQQFFMTE